MNDTPRSRVLMAALALTLAAAAPACGGDDEASDPTTTAAESTTTAAESTTTAAGSGGGSTTTSGGQGGEALNDIQECEVTDGTGAASGAIENLGDQPRSYTLTLGFVDDATGEELGSGTAEVDAVEAGGSGEWTVTVDGLPDAEVTCRTLALDSAPAG